MTGSLVGGVGPTGAGVPPHHRAARQRTPEEDRALHLLDSAPPRAARRRIRLELVERDNCPVCGSSDIARWVDGGDPSAADANDIHAECRACGQYVL